MLSESTNTHSILEFLPPSIRTVIETYGQTAHLSPQLVVEVAIAEFLEIDGLNDLATPSDVSNRQAVSQILDLFPVDLKSAIDAYAHELEMPSEFVVELAIAHFLDPDSMTYEDCQTGVARAQVERLKQKREQSSRKVA
jgi:predicted transcriptional regulator